MLCYNMIEDSVSGIIYGQCKKKGGEESIIGILRSLSIQEFTLVMTQIWNFRVHGVYYFLCLDTFSWLRV